jgi:hypothetical protein
MADSPQDLQALLRHEFGLRPGDPQPVLDHGHEVLSSARRHDVGGDQPAGERGVLSHAQTRRKRGQPYQPHRQEFTAVEVAIEEAGEVEKETIGQMLGLVEHQDRDHDLDIDEVFDRQLELTPQRVTMSRRLQPKADCEVAVDRRGGHRGVADIYDPVLGLGQVVA